MSRDLPLDEAALDRLDSSGGDLDKLLLQARLAIALRARLADAERERDEAKDRLAKYDAPKGGLAAFAEALADRERMEYEPHLRREQRRAAQAEAERDEWQAHAARLREALAVTHGSSGVAFALREYAKANQQRNGKWTDREQRLVDWAIAIDAALAQSPSDALAEVRAQERERCAKWHDEQADHYAKFADEDAVRRHKRYSAAIRAQQEPTP